MQLSVRGNYRLHSASAFAVCAVVVGGTTKVPPQTNLNAVSAFPPVVAIVNGHSIPTNLYEMYLSSGVRNRS
jgi:hypothetical protein